MGPASAGSDFRIVIQKMNVFTPGKRSCVIAVSKESQVLLITYMDDILNVLIDIPGLICGGIIRKNDLITDAFGIFRPRYRHGLAARAA